ncbi:MAG: ABC transporter ATP-binding protein [Verrucomicrobiota bacterium]
MYEDSPSEPAIRVEKARKHYGESATGVDALDGVSLEVPRGQFAAIMGPSGCGKSSLLHALGGLDRLTSGRIWLAGQPLHELDDNELTRLRRHQLGFVFQFFNLLPTLTVAENVRLPALLAGLPEDEAAEREASLLAEVGLDHRRAHQTHQLSGGEMQRAALARALMMNPPVVLADEPTGNLDSVASGKVMGLFQKLGQEHGTTIVMVTHSREVAAAAERLIEMLDGQIRADSRQPAAAS